MTLKCIDRRNRAAGGADETVTIARMSHREFIDALSGFRNGYVELSDMFKFMDTLMHFCKMYVSRGEYDYFDFDYLYKFNIATTFLVARDAHPNGNITGFYIGNVFPDDVAVVYGSCAASKRIEDALRTSFERVARRRRAQYVLIEAHAHNCRWLSDAGYIDARAFAPDMDTTDGHRKHVAHKPMIKYLSKDDNTTNAMSPRSPPLHRGIPSDDLDLRDGIRRVTHRKFFDVLSSGQVRGYVYYAITSRITSICKGRINGDICIAYGNFAKVFYIRVSDGRLVGLLIGDEDVGTRVAHVYVLCSLEPGGGAEIVRAFERGAKAHGMEVSYAHTCTAPMFWKKMGYDVVSKQRADKRNWLQRLLRRPLSKDMLHGQDMKKSLV